MNYLLALFFILHLKVCIISCQSQCVQFQTCSGCISYGNETCVWCSAKDHIGRRCHSKSRLDPSWCKETVYDPVENVKPILNDNFNDGKDEAKVVQLRPQDIKIKARPNVPIKFNMTYKPAKDYPLDVYYLIDSSKTMSGYKEILYNQSLEIHRQLNLITNNVRLGFGTFIEKPSLPYVDITTQESYSFKNHLGLTNNTALFKKALEDIQSSSGSNNDVPEAALDALMQAMVCEKKIGWRNDSHRIILLSTDSNYHGAGDGKFVGAIKPHDMQCHLDGADFTLKSLKFDYPSVSQINKIATKNNIMIIFAVNSYFSKDYEALEKKIKNAKYVPLLENVDVVDMIKKQYQELVSSVQIHATSPPFIKITYETKCTMKDKICIYRFNDSLLIVGTLLIESCPADPGQVYQVKIGPTSIDEKLTLHIEADCQCDCEKPGQEEKNSDLCSNAGTYQCGVCNCNKDRHGDTCNCIGTTSAEDLERCKEITTDPKPCSDRGICRCGKCDCAAGFSGNYCQFDDNSCQRPGGVLCAGHGKCEYGKCQCDLGWLPDDCRCPSNSNSCIAPHSKEPCFGRGACVCGQCVCELTATNEYCVGKYCNECVESHPERCLELEDYAYCNFDLKKTFCDDKFNLTHTEVFLVNKTTIYSDIWPMAKMWCRKKLDDGRILVFRYHYPKLENNSTLLLIIQKDLDVTPVDDVWVVVGSVIGAVLLIGLLTLIAWKILVDLHDKREFEKFKKSSTVCGNNIISNPLYREPATSFSNPVYNPTFNN